MVGRPLTGYFEMTPKAASNAATPVRRIMTRPVVVTGRIGPLSFQLRLTKPLVLNAATMKTTPISAKKMFVNCFMLLCEV
jgi:hypothetical protein